MRSTALASIGAVSRLSLMSCHYLLNKIGWKTYSEGFIHDKEDILESVVQLKGTGVVLERLFYNIPVPLKFMKHENLELVEILKVIKNIVLSHSYINFPLQHNKQSILKYTSVKYKKNRLKDVFSTFYVNKMLQIQLKINYAFLFGWILCSQSFKILKKIRYFYVNKRYYCNNNIINAICASHQKIKEDKHILFILYLKILFNKIDMNIHTAQNEINFHASNKIYTFIYEAILFYLK